VASVPESTLAVSLGDPAGIGPEVIAKCWDNRAEFNLPPFVITHENTDERSGTELGLVCTQCQDAIMGLHPKHSSSSKTTITDDGL